VPSVFGTSHRFDAGGAIDTVVARDGSLRLPGLPARRFASVGFGGRPFRACPS